MNDISESIIAITPLIEKLINFGKDSKTHALVVLIQQHLHTIQAAYFSSEKNALELGVNLLDAKAEIFELKKQSSDSNSKEIFTKERSELDRRIKEFEVIKANSDAQTHKNKMANTIDNLADESARQRKVTRSHELQEE